VPLRNQNAAPSILDRRDEADAAGWEQASGAELVHSVKQNGGLPAQAELIVRQIRATEAAMRASDRASRRLEWLTIAIVVLTAVLAVKAF
jgi:hypothetical protein